MYQVPLLVVFQCVKEGRACYLILGYVFVPSLCHLKSPGQPCNGALQAAYAMALGYQWKKALLDRQVFALC
ncbi:hypothetical protein MC885_000942 [Smutsia gigantea]|nr:hypothetical protein MC885_000942 [Smutsia gigantea]